MLDEFSWRGFYQLTRAWLFTVVFSGVCTTFKSVFDIYNNNWGTANGFAFHEIQTDSVGIGPWLGHLAGIAHTGEFPYEQHP
jgi:hypothetical protein